MKVDVIGDLAALQEPVRLEARTVVLRDEFDQPILVAQAMGNGKIFVSRAGSPDFEDALKSLGLDVKVNYREVKV
jgi:hypothetical protein